MVARLPYLTEAALDAEVRGHEGRTPYVRWGDAPALMLIALALAVGFVLARRQSQPAP